MQRRVALNINSLNKCSLNHYSKCKDLAPVHINIPDSMMKNAFYKDKWNCEIVQAQFDCTIFLNSLLCIIFNLMEAYRLHFNVNVSEFSHVKKVKQYLICVKLSTFSILGMHFITAIVEFIQTIYYLFIKYISKCCSRKLWKAIISWNFE